MRFHSSLLLLSVAVEATFRTVTSKYDSENAIRIKEHIAGNEICDSERSSYSGWADIGSRHIFYWFHESKKIEKDVPVMLWLQGGPGGASTIGALAENGPCLITADGNSERNPFSWTEEYHMVYVDQPVGAGFSYVDNHHDTTAYHNSTEAAALDIIAFIKLFQEGFPELANNPLTIAGESYGGRYVPIIGASIIDYNRLVSKESRIPLNSLIVVNGWTSPPYQAPGIYDVGCYDYKGQPPYFSPEECELIARSLDQMTGLLSACSSSGDSLMCTTAGKQFSELILDPMQSKRQNMYDRRMKCPEPGRCYPKFRAILSWLNSDEVMNNYFEVPEQTNGIKLSVSLENDTVRDAMTRSGDFWKDTAPFVEKILQHSSSEIAMTSESAVDMLFMAGNMDVTCGPYGMQRFLDDAKWKYHPEFRNAPWEELRWPDGQRSEYDRVKRTKGLWLVDIAEAGHVAPMDQPSATWNIIKLWLAETSQKEARIENLVPEHSREL